MLVHVIPESSLANTHHGSYKDVISRVRWFEANVADYRQVLVTDDDPSVVAEVLGRVELSGALVEYSFYPRIVRWLKDRASARCVAVRSINLEPLQHLDNHGWWPKRGPVWMLYGMWRLMLQDIRCKRHADVILSINDWENRVYWNRLPGRAKIEWLPYYCPEHLIPKNPMPYEQRRIIACMPTSQKNRKSWDLVSRFIRFAEAMKAVGADYDFLVTGRLNDWGLPESPHVSYTGFVDDISAFMGACRAVCMLSPLGYGFKTTIGDSLAAGAHVLAHPKLIRRCPSRVRPYLLSVKTEDSVDCVAIMKSLGEVPTGMAAHQDVRRRNHDLLHTLFIP